MISVLTEDEINVIADKHEAALGGVWPHEFAEAIIDATIKRLSAGVSVEPVAEVRTLHYGSEHPPVAFTGVVLANTTDYYSLPFKENAQFYTLDQLNTESAAARVQMNERCLNAINEISAGLFDCDALGRPVYGYIARWRALEAISALLGKEQS